MLTPADESFGHQLVAPATVTQHGRADWAERCYHLLDVGNGTILHAGRSLYPNEGRRAGFAGINDGSTQEAIRLAAPWEGGDRDVPDVGGLRIEATRPLSSVRLVLKEPESALAFDLRYEARFPAVATAPNLIERDGEVLTHYMNFFQSGLYSGTVSLDGEVFHVRERAGFRDRGWGVRAHEGSPRRGLVIACFCELPEAAIYLMLYETASGRRAFTNGWWFEADGTIAEISSVEHDLRWEEGLLSGGRLRLRNAAGERELGFEVLGRLFLKTAGYSADPAWKEPGRERHDVTLPETRALLDGQNDSACAFALDDGTAGHGYVETGLGIHSRYRPDPD